MKNLDKAWERILEISDELDKHFNININYSFRTFRNDETEDLNSNLAFFSRSKKKSLAIHPYLLEMIEEGKEREVESILYHEYLHFYHFININKLNINKDFLFKRKRMSAYNFVINIGYQFWTEFEAFYMTKEKYKDIYIDSFNTQDMIRNFKEFNENFYKKHSDEEISNILFVCDQFIYSLGRYLGENYSKEIEKQNENDKEIKQFYKIKEDLTKLCVKMNKKRFSKYLPRRLYNIGRYLMKYVYIPCHVYICRYDKYWGFGYVKEG